MSLPSEFPDKLRFFVCVGGDKKKPDPMQLGLAQVVCPTTESSDMDVEQSAFIGYNIPPTQTNLEQFCAAAEAGTIMCGIRDLGNPTSAMMTGMPPQYNSSETNAGNNPLLDILNQVSSDQSRTGKRIKPKIVERTVNGVLVREMEEKGKNWSHALTKGLAVHAAWHPMLGQALNEVKNIETALQNFANIPTAGMLSQLPGKIMNIGSLFNSMTSAQKRQATQKMSPLLVQGLENMLLLSGSSETSGEYVSSGRVNPEIYTQNMIDLLSEVDNIGDLINVMERLQYDETLRGLDSYSPREFTGLTANSVSNTDTTAETSEVVLSLPVANSLHYFDEGYSINVASQTYVVVTANQSSNTITVYPRVENEFSSSRLYVYLPVAEYETEGPYGPMTITMDINGNVKPDKNSAQKIQQAMQAIQSLMSTAEGGQKNLFGDAGGIMSQLFNRIPNNIRASVLTDIAQTAKQKLDSIHKLAKRGAYPF